MCAAGFSEHHTGRAVDISNSRLLRARGRVRPNHCLCLGSINMLPNSATISLIPLAILGVINMSLGIGVFKTPNPCNAPDLHEIRAGRLI